MATDLPYLLTNKRLPEVFEQIQSAGIPERFTFEFLKKLGFNSSNDRGLVSLIKKLGFVDPNSVPTERYRALKHKSEAKRVLAEAIRDLYSELYAINENVHDETKENIRGIVGRVTGADEKYINLMTATFQALAKLADFSQHHAVAPDRDEKESEKPASPPIFEDHKSPKHIAFRHNIEIHLPATTDIGIYNAIFKSLREHLFE